MELREVSRRPLGGAGASVQPAGRAGVRRAPRRDRVAPRRLVSRDWDAWARRVEKALDVAHRSETDFQDLFAPDGTFIDPTQVAKTPELPEVSRATQAIFPDWTQEVTSIRGDDDWAAFERIGPGAVPRKGKSAGRAIEMEGVTLVEVDSDGLVTKWRDYFDMKGVEEQMKPGSDAVT